jgi:peptide deformylase
MLRRMRYLRCGGIPAPSGRPATTSGDADDDSSSGASSARTKKTMSESEREYLELLRSKVASYPCRGLTRPLSDIPLNIIRRPSFETNIMRITRMAQELDSLSFCAPKAHWSAPVILVKKSAEAKDFDLWVNPDVPGYDDKNSVSPMYGMWENCSSCGPLMAWVVRPQQIVGTGLDQFGDPKKEVLKGLHARLFMHELDHLRGKSMMNQCMGSEFVVSTLAMHQRSLWPVNYPSAEAYATLPGAFFDYTTNCVVPVEGMEEFMEETAREMFGNKTIRSS